tara:strand:- start:247 stop:936 length:690 start_codon:yes stop_codon:yes gene_type:complete
MAVRKTTVYYGSAQGHPLEMSLTKPEPLFKSLKGHFKKNDLEGLLKCPSLAASTHNTYAINAPVDLKIVLKGSGAAYAYATMRDDDDFELGKWHTMEGKNVAQWLGDGFITFFAEESTIATLMPPYHHTNKIYGISGSFDIGRWFRAMSFSSRYHEPIIIKAGEPMAYIRFDKAVDLKRVVITDELRKDMKACLEFKAAHRNKALSYVYEKFVQSKKRDRVLKLLREQL